jgi:hypothetical protein
MLITCSGQNNSDDCEDNGFVWLEFEDRCVCNPDDLTCDYYLNDTACNGDEYDLGPRQTGCGSNIVCNGSLMTISVDNCSCQWNPSAPVGKQCVDNKIVTETNYAGTPDTFDCSNVYDLGECVNGQQDINWTSTSTIISGFIDIDPDIFEDCLCAADCCGGEATRLCGEPIIKLPGFSLFAFFMSLFIIGMYYSFRKD